MRYVLQHGNSYGTRYASEPMQLGEYDLEDLLDG